MGLRSKIRPEEALLLLFFLGIFFFRLVVGGGLPPIGPLTDWMFELFWKFLPLAVYILCIIPFIIEWIKSLFNNLKGEKRIDYNILYKKFFNGFGDVLKFFKGFLPFIVIVALYDSFTNRYSETGFNLTRVIVKTDLTHLLIKADELLFGTQVSYILQDYIKPWITDLMYFGYSLHFFFPFILALYFYTRGREKYFQELMLAVVTVSCIGYVGYLTFPSTSPVYILEYERGLEGGRVSDFVLAEIDKVRSAQSDCCLFPSLHVGISSVTLILAFKRERRFFYVLLPFIVLSWVSAVYLRRHFVIDIIAGWIVAAAAIYLTPKIDRIWYGRDSIP
ncbi:MAG: phosphatase PAP2 family protein [Methanobacteriota archaeon]